MGIRMLHRRKASARVHATALTAAGETAEGAGTPRRPVPALAPRAAVPRAPRTPLTAARALPARLGRAVAARARRTGTDRLGPLRTHLARLTGDDTRTLRTRITHLARTTPGDAALRTHMTRLTRRDSPLRLRIDLARGYAALARAALARRLPRRRASRRIAVFVASTRVAHATGTAGAAGRPGLSGR
ncbi:hypothetical protein ACIPPJ_10345 [Streptomyces sp. NPDC086091]|uniref:hypothetical protein n=1 Tax=Streptomyces sp. NPDC086091 TaxID=3365751 RepID=UPI003829DFA4